MGSHVSGEGLFHGDPMALELPATWSQEGYHATIILEGLENTSFSGGLFMINVLDG